MTTYAKFAPTGFDPCGAFLDDRQNWLVVSASRTRDSDALAESNFAVALRMLGGESDTVEVHRFGHWGPGWFEIILVDPADVARVAEVEAIDASLSDYPVLNEEDWSERERNDATEFWARLSVRMRANYCREAHVSIFAARRDYLPEDPDGRLYESLRRA